MKTLFFFLSMLFISTFTFAQGMQRMMDASPEEIAKFRTQQLNDTVQLDTLQMRKVYKINLEHAKELKAMQNDRQGDRQAMRDKFQTLRDKHQKSIMLVLNKDQIKKYKEMEQQIRQRAADERPRRQN